MIWHSLIRPPCCTKESEPARGLRRLSPPALPFGRSLSSPHSHSPTPGDKETHSLAQPTLCKAKGSIVSLTAGGDRRRRRQRASRVMNRRMGHNHCVNLLLVAGALPRPATVPSACAAAFTPPPSNSSEASYWAAYQPDISELVAAVFTPYHLTTGGGEKYLLSGESASWMMDDCVRTCDLSEVLDIDMQRSKCSRSSVTALLSTSGPTTHVRA